MSDNDMTTNIWIYQITYWQTKFDEDNEEMPNVVLFHTPNNDMSDVISRFKCMTRISGKEIGSIIEIKTLGQSEGYSEE